MFQVFNTTYSCLSLCKNFATVNDVAKIHSPDPSVNDHFISFASSDLWITLNLNSTFSYFHSQRPTQDEFSSYDNILITPDAQQ